MNFRNPTLLRIGMSANLTGQDYQLVGRSVLGERENCETYYWHEFNLETSAGESATLVYDRTEEYAHWRLFTQFSPESPLSAAEATAKRVGDRLNLTGHDVRVSFRGSSTVYFIEGQGPADEVVGTAANYFNATAGSVMQVISWTGEEVEFYDGVTLTAGMIATAFGLPQILATPEYSTADTDDKADDSRCDVTARALKWGLIAMVVVIFGALIFTRSASCSRQHIAAPVQKVFAGPPPMVVGAAGMLFNRPYRVTAHAVVEMAEQGARWEQHEYELTGSNGSPALLVCGGRASTDWVCYEPLSLFQPITPGEAAAKRLGDAVELDGATGRVSEIFQCMVEPSADNRDGDSVGSVRYGFRTGETSPLLVRWNNDSIQFYRGRSLPAKRAAAAFAQAERAGQ